MTGGRSLRRPAFPKGTGVIDTDAPRRFLSALVRKVRLWDPKLDDNSIPRPDCGETKRLRKRASAATTRAPPLHTKKRAKKGG
jgi:hypothetical protein